MGHEIHARSRKKGMVYRVWSNGVNMYFTKPLSIEELREELFLSSIIKHIDREIDNAKFEKGKSGEILSIEEIFLFYQNRWIKRGELDSKPDLDGSWQKQNKPFSFSKEDKAEYERRNKLIKKVLRYLLRNM